MARYTCGRGVTQRRACALLSSPRSGLSYCSRLEHRDRGLARALKLISKHHPARAIRLMHSPETGFRRIPRAFLDNLFLMRSGPGCTVAT